MHVHAILVSLLRIYDPFLLSEHTLETTQGPVCPLNWRTVFICFYIVLHFCFVQFNKTVYKQTTGVRLDSDTCITEYDTHRPLVITQSNLSGTH